MKKTLSILLIGVLLILSTSSLAEGYLKKIDVLMNGIGIEINGELVEFDSEPFIYNNRTYLPIRPIAEALNFNVKYDSINNRAIISRIDDIPECDYLSGEIFIYGMITQIDLENRTIEIEQHFDDNSREVTPLLPVREDVLIVFKRNDKAMTIDFSDLKCGDVLGGIVDKEGFIRGIIISK